MEGMVSNYSVFAFCVEWKENFGKKSDMASN